MSSNPFFVKYEDLFSAAYFEHILIPGVLELADSYYTSFHVEESELPIVLYYLVSFNFALFSLCYVE